MRKTFNFHHLIAIFFSAWVGLGFAEIDKTKKVLIIGLDGTLKTTLYELRDQLPNILPQGNNYFFPAYAGGKNNKETEQWTVSAPGWTSVFTGTWADKHGVRRKTGPDYFRDYRPDDAPHLFEYIKQHSPESNIVSIASWEPLHSELLAHCADCATQHTIKFERNVSDKKATAKAIDVLQNEDPDVLFVYFEEIDDVGHFGGGFGSKPYKEKILESDQLVGSILTAVENRPDYDNEEWLILLVTDHGGSGKIHGGSSNVKAHRMAFIIAHGTGDGSHPYFNYHSDQLTEDYRCKFGITSSTPTILSYLGIDVGDQFASPPLPSLSLPECKIDKAFYWRKGNAIPTSTMFFHNDQYIRFNNGFNTVDNGYPRFITGNWHGQDSNPAKWLAQAEQAFFWKPTNFSDARIMFFDTKRNEFVRYDVDDDRVNRHYPKPLSNWGFPENWLTKDTLIFHTGKKIMFFNADAGEYIRYDSNKDKIDSGYPKPIDHKTWPGLDTEWLKSVDTAFYFRKPLSTSEYIMFFNYSAGNYVRFNLKDNRVDKNYPQPINHKNWPYLLFWAD